MPRFETCRAKVGATLLDLLRPGWANEIRTDRLDLASCQVCVLGQLFGSYEEGAAKVFAMRFKRKGVDPRDFNARYEAASEAGFCVPDEYQAQVGEPLPKLYRKLTDAWKREIAKRRAGKAVCA
jgi:hypothetical protein